MPCRDYMDDFEPMRTQADLRQRLDMLSRIACKALEHIEKSNDGLEVLLLQDAELATWWKAHKAADKKARELEERKLAELKRKAELEEKRTQAKAKLTPEEIKILGIK